MKQVLGSNVVTKFILAMAALLFAEMSFATAIANTDQFYEFYDFVITNLNGGLGVAIALLAFLISIVIAATTQSGMPLVIGVVVAVGISFGPGMIEDIVTSGSMIPAELLTPAIIK